MMLAITAFLVILGFLDETGVILSIALVLGLLFGASYVAGLGWHMAT